MVKNKLFALTQVGPLVAVYIKTKVWAQCRRDLNKFPLWIMQQSSDNLIRNSIGGAIEPVTIT